MRGTSARCARYVSDSRRAVRLSLAHGADVYAGGPSVLISTVTGCRTGTLCAAGRLGKRTRDNESDKPSIQYAISTAALDLGLLGLFCWTGGKTLSDGLMGASLRLLRCDTQARSWSAESLLGWQGLSVTLQTAAVGVHIAHTLQAESEKRLSVIDETTQNECENASDGCMIYASPCGCMPQSLGAASSAQ